MSIECLNADGFSFENCKRNKLVEKNSGFHVPKAVKTGTTIAGIVYKDGVVLGADTIATNGQIVADKNCSKIHQMADNIYCCGAGTAADCDFVTKMIMSQLELQRLNLGRPPRVAAATRALKQHLFNYQGHIGAALILGGVDCTGPHLFSVAPHGSTDKVPYVTNGSGSLAAMAVFEENYKPNMERDAAVRLVRDAIAAGIFNDMGSGSNVDLCVISDEGVEYLRPYEIANVKGQREDRYTFEAGSTTVLTRKIEKVEYDVVTTRIMRAVKQDDDLMETD
jgi:20S proteasome subunit beta 2